MKRWRYHPNKRMTPEIKTEIKILREQDWTWKEIAEKVGFTVSTIRYHMVPGIREKVTKRNCEYYQRNKDKLRDSRKNYIREYMRERYNDDPEFKERILKHMRNYRQRIRDSELGEKGE